MKKLVVSLALVAVLLLPVVALAQVDIPIPNPTGGETELIPMIQNIIRIILGLLGLIAVILLLYGGFTWMTAAGNDDQISKAKGIMKATIIGLIIIFAAWAIAEFVISNMMTATGL